MIVPFIFGLEDNELNYLWIFYKYFDFCKKNKFPIIAQEDYFKEIQKNKFDEFYANVEGPGRFKYTLPTQAELQIKNKNMIFNKDIDDIIKKYDSKEQAWVSLLKERNYDFEKIIEKIIKKINRTKKIDAILVWCWIPSVKYIAKKYNIELIMMELSSIRRPFYSTDLCFFNFNNKYSSDNVFDEYCKFRNINKILLSRKEILALFIEKENIAFLDKIDEAPCYDFGCALGIENDYSSQANDGLTNNELIKKVKKISGNRKSSLRMHPTMNIDKNDGFFVVDKSDSSFEWIIKCQRIICNVSNVGFEAMLLGKTVLPTNKNIAYSLGKTWDFKQIEDGVADNDLINYFIFCYFVPYDLAFDKEYIEWRLKKPSLQKIYEKHFRYIMNLFELDIDNLADKSSDEKLQIILMKIHKISKNDTIKFLEHSEVSFQNNRLEKIKKLNIELNKKQKINNDLEINVMKYKEQINNILNSKSWKITRPLRKISSIIKKEK